MTGNGFRGGGRSGLKRPYWARGGGRFRNNWRGRNTGGRNRGWRGNRGNASGYGSMSSFNGSQNSIDQTDELITSYFEPEGCPYIAWKHYLSDIPYSETSPVIPKLKCAIEYIKQYIKIKREDLHDTRFFEVDISHMLKDEHVKTGWQHLREDLDTSAEKTCGILSLAKHHLVIQEMKEENPQLTKVEANFPTVRARIKVKQEITHLRQLKSGYYGRMVTIKATVVKISSIRPVTTWLAFRCNVCLSEFAVHQPEGKLTLPKRCPPGNGCRNTKSFRPLRSSKSTVTEDLQQVRLQEMEDAEDDDENMDSEQSRSSGGGRIPRTIECELKEDLCDTCVPGDVISVTGVVKVIAEEGGGSRKNNSANNPNSVFLMYITALNVRNTRTKGNRTGSVGIEFTYNDFAAIQEIHSYGSNILKLLVDSLCPSIFGHHLVKTAMLLGLFGGNSKKNQEEFGNPFAVRSDPHILVVGDPGMGKSQILWSVAGVAPRGIFVTGNTASISGLTVTVSRGGDDGGGSIEAGALVLGDQGCCCIDEFDKMGSTQHSALLEAMEQQCISIAKAGVVCSLPARTAILAAANPIDGHYNRGKTVSENLRLNPALLSRFDVVFILIDRPDLELDSLLSEHVMALHSNHNPQKPSLTRKSRIAMQEEENITEERPQRLSLKKRLISRENGFTEDPLPPTILRKYIAYARRFVFPKLTPGACQVLQDFYLNLRRNHHSADGTPVTTRQLESLIRLTEARAKLELREEATAEDAEDVVEIMKQSICDTLMDEMGTLDLNRSYMGSGMSQKNAGKRLVSALQRHGQNLHKNTFTTEEIKQIARSVSVPMEKVHDLILSLNNQGYLIQKGPRIYQLMSLDC